MRLLFVSHSFPPDDAPMRNVGGMQRVATELHSALRERDDVVVETIVLRSSWKWVHLKAVPFFVSLAVRLGRAAKTFDADTVLFTSVTTALPLLVAGPSLRERGVRLAAIAHGLDVTDANPAYQLAVRRLCRMFDAVMPVSRATAEELIARGLSREKVHVVPNAVDLDRFEGASQGRGSNETVSIGSTATLPRDVFLIVAVGRQVRRKGFAWFIENVVPRLPDRVVLVLAGDGPEHERIGRVIEERGLESRVRRLGRIAEDQLLELYRQGDLFIMPNIVVPGDMEGFGIVMLEAGACGLPTLAADLEGIRDVVTEGVNGWLAPSADADAFVERIQWLLDQPEELKAARARTASHVRSTFRWDATTSRYLDILRGDEGRA